MNREVGSLCFGGVHLTLSQSLIFVEKKMIGQKPFALGLDTSVGSLNTPVFVCTNWDAAFCMQ